MYRKELLKAAAAVRDLSKAEFARQAGIGINTVNKMWNGETNIGLNRLITACEFLSIPLSQLFAPASNGSQQQQEAQHESISQELV